MTTRTRSSGMIIVRAARAGHDSRRRPQRAPSPFVISDFFQISVLEGRPLRNDQARPKDLGCPLFTGSFVSFNQAMSADTDARMEVTSDAD
jgi:hypothetical protein